MRKVALCLIACASLAAACSGKGEFIPTPAPAPEPPSTTAAPVVATTPTSAAPAIVTPADEEPEAPPAPPTTIDWGPVLCPSLSHPRHHEPCPVASSAGAKSRPPSEANLTKPAASSGSSSSALASIRACESHNNYSTDTGNGYYGAYQFAPSTWASVGGTGNPAHASPAEQDMRAQMMIDAGRRGEWPNC